MLTYELFKVSSSGYYLKYSMMRCHPSDNLVLGEMSATSKLSTVNEEQKLQYKSARKVVTYSLP